MKGMESLPDLAQLTPVQKDELIHTLWGLVGALRQEVIELKAEVADRRGRLAQTSRNSSKPPSSEGDAKPKPKSLRTPGKNPTGGQKGHAGPTLSRPSIPTPALPTHRRRPAIRAVCCSRRRQWLKPAKSSICRPRSMKSRNTGGGGVLR
jgi:Family of unknown function (DUF6444)